MPTFPMVCRHCARVFPVPIRLAVEGEPLPIEGGCPHCGRPGEIAPGGYEISETGDFHFFQRIDEALQGALLSPEELERLAIIADAARADPATHGEQLRKTISENPKLKALADMLPEPNGPWGGFAMWLCAIITMLVSVRREYRESRKDKNASKRRRRSHRGTKKKASRKKSPGRGGG